MKKFYTLILLATFFKAAFSQCTPDPYLTGSGFTPAELPPAYADAAYNQVLSFMAPKDTTTVINGNTVNVTIDTVILIDLVGVPANFNYQCLNACLVKGGEKGCALLTGQADISQVGQYRIKVVLETRYTIKNTTFHANRFDSADQYHFKIYAETGLFSIGKETKATEIKAFPNPATNQVQFDLSDLPHHSSGTLTIVDVLGRAVYNGTFRNNNPGSINISSFTPGVYKCMIRTDDATYYTGLVRN